MIELYNRNRFNSFLGEGERDQPGWSQEERVWSRTILNGSLAPLISARINSVFFWSILWRINRAIYLSRIYFFYQEISLVLHWSVSVSVTWYIYLKFCSTLVNERTRKAMTNASEKMRESTFPCIDIPCGGACHIGSRESSGYRGSKNHRAVIPESLIGNLLRWRLIKALPVSRMAHLNCFLRRSWLKIALRAGWSKKRETRRYFAS